MANFSLAAVLLLGAFSLAPAQEILVMTSGVQIQGRYAGGGIDTVNFVDSEGHHGTYDTYDIREVIFSLTKPRGYSDTNVEPAVGWVRYRMLPAGTEISVRTIDSIDTENPPPDQYFLATIDRDVTDATGNVIIPKGASAHLIARPVGDGDFAIDLRSVNIRDQRYLLNAQNIAADTPLLGTVLGADAGNRSGGAGPQIRTRGKLLRIPPQTVLRFQLEEITYLYQ
jgi:hypothetical protein